MAKIKLTAGIFCWQHNIIRAGDPAIEVDDATARRLVEEKGVAVYAAPTPVAPVLPNEDLDTELPEGVVGILEYSVDTKADDLRAIGELFGLTFKKGMSKADMVAALNAHIEENSVDGFDMDDAEDAPAFDATEAVQ